MLVVLVDAEIGRKLTEHTIQMEGKGVQLVERDMGVDLQFTSTAGTVFWDDGILSRFQPGKTQSSQQSLDEIVSHLHHCFVYCYAGQGAGLRSCC